LLGGDKMSENIITIPRQVVLEPKMFTGNSSAQFALGDIVVHKVYGYHGLIFDVDAIFCQTEEWYEMMATSNPPKDVPWYHVLVDGEDHTTYVPQENLIISQDEKFDIEHPLLGHFFQQSPSGLLQVKTPLN